MSEVVTRKIPLKKIADDKEEESCRIELENALQEQAWCVKFKTTEERAKNINISLDDYQKQLEEAEGEKKKINSIKSKIHTLHVKLEMLQDGIYESVLTNNIRAYTLMIDEYDARKIKTSPGKAIIGIIKGDTVIRENVRKRLVFALSNAFGIVEKPKSLKAEPGILKRYVR